MPNKLFQKIKELPHLRLLIILFTVWQYVSVACIALLNWPQSLAWLNLGLLLAFIFLSPIYESLLLLILSIPFYIVLPNDRFDSLSMWRILFLALFLVWFMRDRKFHFKGIIFLPWDKYLAWFAGVGLLLAFVFGRYHVEAVKQLIFWLNIYLFYIVLINSLRGKQHIFEMIRYVVWSLAIIITLGFAQLIATFLVNIDTFWVFWATNITRLYYGNSFAAISLFSNSWFANSGSARELRMFSIMPDSQSFAYICIFGLCIGTALTKNVFVHIRKWLWSGIRFAGLALILSGTRAVWVGMVTPFLVVVVGYVYNIQKHLAKRFLLPFAIIFILFAASPLINKGLALLQVHVFKEDFLSRAESIYDFNETSNAGRIAMWKNSAGFFLTHPWGVGFGNFIISFNPNSESQSYSDLAQKINPRYNLPDKYVSAHSLYLQILVETGVVGFTLFAAIWVNMVHYFWKFIKNYSKKEDFLVYFVAQALLMVLWLLTAAIFDITLFNDKVLMFFFINIGLAGIIVQRYHEYEETEH